MRLGIYSFTLSILLLQPTKTSTGIELIIPADRINQQIRSLDLCPAAHLGAGFFCELGKVLAAIIQFHDQEIIRVSPDWTYEFFPYKDSPVENGWDLFFESITQITNDNTIKQIKTSGSHDLHDQTCTAQWVLYDQYLTYRQYGQQKMTQFFKVKQHIQEQANNFYNSHLHGASCIGVHVRFAGAHSHEVPGGKPPTLDHYFAEVDQITKSTSTPTKIYIASDSHFVVNQFKQRYGDRLFYIDAFRAPHKEDPHLIYSNADYWLAHPAEWHAKKPGYIGGLTALLDCLILSKCEYLIHSTSNVSTFACFFNPHIKSIYLPKGLAPYCGAMGSSSVKNPFLNPQ